jgi:hypothetical protein
MLEAPGGPGTSESLAFGATRAGPGPRGPAALIGRAPGRLPLPVGFPGRVTGPECQLGKAPWQPARRRLRGC